MNATSLYSENTFTLKVNDNSMLPEFVNGEVLYIDANVKAKNNSLIAIEKQGALSIRKLTVKGSKKYLKSLNNVLGDIEMQADELIRGVVVGSYRSRLTEIMK